MYVDNVNTDDLFDPDVLLEPVDLNNSKIIDVDQDLVLDLFQEVDSLCLPENTKIFDSPQHALADLNNIPVASQPTQVTLKTHSLDNSLNVQQLYNPNLIQTRTDTLQLPANINLMQYAVNQTTPVTLTSSKPVRKVLIQPTTQKKRILPSNDGSLTNDLIRILKEQENEKQKLLQHLSQLPQQKVQQVFILCICIN